MARKKKIVNNTPYPQHAIDAVARCLWPDIVAFFESEEGQKGTVKYYAQIHLQVWQHSVCTGQGNLPLIT